MHIKEHDICVLVERIMSVESYSNTKLQLVTHTSWYSKCSDHFWPRKMMCKNEHSGWMRTIPLLAVFCYP